MPGKLQVGIVLRQEDLEENGRRLGELTQRIVNAGIDHVTVGDHVSFAGGMGADGLIQATALLCSHPDLRVETGVYLITVRHPAPVARQLATLCAIAPGRFTFGLGIGGDDPRELELCGVDPKRRGARADESIELLRAFMGGGEVSFEGEFFSLSETAIRPAPEPAPRLLVVAALTLRCAAPGASATAGSGSGSLPADSARRASCSPPPRSRPAATPAAPNTCCSCGPASVSTKRAPARRWRR